jgi:hypothetical protein
MDLDQDASLPCNPFYQLLESGPRLLHNALLELLQHLATCLGAGHLAQLVVKALLQACDSAIIPCPCAEVNAVATASPHAPGPMHVKPLHNCLLSIHCLADDLYLRVEGQQGSQTFARGLSIVGNQNPYSSLHSLPFFLAQPLAASSSIILFSSVFGRRRLPDGGTVPLCV